jgi:hypothetical protein
MVEINLYRDYNITNDLKKIRSHINSELDTMVVDGQGVLIMDRYKARSLK